MTTEEFSNEFDILVDSYKRFKTFDSQESLDSIEFSEYEKSLFLTKYQETLVVSLYTGKNNYNEGFESTEELRRYLANLVIDAKLTPITNTSGNPLGLSSTSKFFTLPDDLWFIIYESVTVSDSKCTSKNTLKVYPTKEDEYQSIKDNPFRGPNTRRALRLDLSEGNVEIVCKKTVTEYYIRYIKKLTPIIVAKLPNSLTIGNENDITECQLHEALHRKILDGAVAMALQSKGYSIKKESSDN